MASILDLAILSLDVYSRETNDRAFDAGWVREDAQNWANGFAGGIYRHHRSDEVVVAIRGTETDDMEDILADLIMVPILQRGQARNAVRDLLDQYQVPRGTLFDMAPEVMERLGRIPASQLATMMLGNSVPAEQTANARAYLSRCRPAPSYVTGHSLGGALTKVVALSEGIPGVAFNSPFMGMLRGIARMSSSELLSVNTIGDPLSALTWHTAGLSRGPVINVEVPRRYHPPLFRRTPLLERLRRGPGGLLTRDAEDFARYHSEILDYLGQVALYFHGMEPLVNALGRRDRFRRPLTRDFSEA